MTTKVNHHLHTPPTSGMSFDDLVVQVSELAEAGKMDRATELINLYPEHADRLERLLPAIEALASLDVSAPDALDEITQPTRELGDFRIVREIGRGGMGVVYEAEQLSLGRRIALKVLPLAATLSVEQLQRFKNEARLAASLKHPHIVGVHAVGVERGVHYYAMELVEGCSLAQAIADLTGDGRQTPASPSEVSDTAETSPVAALSTMRTENPQGYFRQVAKIIADAADALDYAHTAGIVHRDIKPGNLLLDADGKVSVTDFGLARLEADAGVTLTGDLLGTLRYMSPEQAAGNPGLVDYRTDIHALGATLYELLAMRPTFKGSDRVKLLRDIAEDAPPALRQIDPRVPLDLETITAKALEKEPADRYQSAEELASDLRAFLEDRPIKASPPSLRQRVTKWSRRHAALVWTAGACALLLSGLATWLITKDIVEHRAMTVAVEASLTQAREAMAAEQPELAQRALDQSVQHAKQIGDAGSPLRRQIAELQRELTRYGEFAEKYQRARWGRTKTNTFAKKALAVYGVEDDAGWAKSLERSNVPQVVIDRVTENVYELLVLLAQEKILWFQDRQTTEGKLKTIADAETYLSRAAKLRSPSKGYYWVLAACSQRMGDLTEGAVRDHHDTEALRLRALAQQTSPQNAAELLHIATDRRWGCADKGEREPFRWPFENTEQRSAAYRDMLRIEPDYYNALFFQSYCLAKEKKYEAAVEGWNGCLVSHPDDFVVAHNRGIALCELGLFEEGFIDLRRSTDIARQKMELEDDSHSKERYAALTSDFADMLRKADDTAGARARFSEAKLTYEQLLEAFPKEQSYAAERDKLEKHLTELDREPADQSEGEVETSDSQPSNAPGNEAEPPVDSKPPATSPD